MELLTILAADYANVEQAGKLNVMGIFRTVNARKFPARHASMHLVIKLGAELGEYGGDRELIIILVDEDGKELLRIAGEMEVPQPVGGQRPEVNAIIELKDIVFPKPGQYNFVVLVDKDHKGSLTIDVVQIEKNEEQ